MRTATLSVLGVLAIPFLTVSSAALMAGPVSTADPVRLSTGLLAAIIGSAVGLSVLRIAQSALLGVRAVVAAAVDWIESASEIISLRPTTLFAVVPATRPVVAVHASSLGRRGPPSGL